MADDSTLYALSTPQGRSALAVIRLSGPGSGSALDRLAGRRPPPRRASVRLLRHPVEAGPIDRALVLWLPGPGTFTGEDMAELHVHGGSAVIRAVLDALAALPGLRPAEPGAFTRRAFDNGKYDLTAVEGLADLLAAETAAQRAQALSQLEGGLAALQAAWRSRLLRLMALCEASIDFPDEDLPSGLLETARDDAVTLKDEMRARVADAHRGERLRDGYQVALVGPPNAGKSSLLNALARRDVAIVTDEPGTTRDLIELHLDLAGYPVTVIDMAGLREAPGKAEALGVARARARAADADLRLILAEGPRWPDIDKAALALRRPGDLLIATKADLLPTERRPDADLSVSILTGEGVEGLVTALGSRVAAALRPGPGAPLTRHRHRRAIETAADALDRALAGWAGPPELVAEDLRLAACALAELTGAIGSDEVLGAVFETFCIGK